MVKRIVCAGLWLLALGWASNYVSVIIGAPPVIGFALSAAVSAFVGMDPFRMFWVVPDPPTTERARGPVTISRITRPEV